MRVRHCSCELGQESCCDYRVGLGAVREGWFASFASGSTSCKRSYSGNLWEDLGRLRERVDSTSGHSRDM